MTYTLITHQGMLYYVEGDVYPQELARDAEVLEDGIPEGRVPDEVGTYCLGDLPAHVLATPRDLDDEAACRADHQMDQERDDRPTGDR